MLLITRIYNYFITIKVTEAIKSYFKDININIISEEYLFNMSTLSMMVVRSDGT